VRFTTEGVIIPETQAEIVTFAKEVIFRAHDLPWTRESSYLRSKLSWHVMICDGCLDAGARITPDRLDQVQKLTDELIRYFPAAQVKTGSSGEEGEETAA
jgi:hypothetical protein